MSIVEPQTELRCLHAAPVVPEQIDQLGHMNVRFYGVRAMAASRRLADDLALEQRAGDGVAIAFTGMFTRHYREQLEGAELEVHGGVLDAGPDAIRVYHELRNPALEELSATFVHTMQLQETATRRAVSFADGMVDDCAAQRVAWPEHGRPRSVDIDRSPVSLPLEEARSRALENRQPRTITEAECDSSGLFAVGSYMDLIWGGIDATGEDDDDWLRDLENGGKFGYATMEVGATLNRLPRAGDRIQSFGCEVDLGKKTRQERYWVYDLDREDILCSASIVNVAFDIAARKAIEIPAKYRVQLEKRYHPDLR